MEAESDQQGTSGPITITFSWETSTYLRSAVERTPEVTVLQYVQAAIFEYTHRMDAKRREAERRQRGGIVLPRERQSRTVPEWPH